MVEAVSNALGRADLPRPTASTGRLGPTVAGPAGSDVAPGSAGRPAGVALLTAHPATCDAVAGLLRCDDPWEATASASPGVALLDRYPATTQTLETLLRTP